MNKWCRTQKLTSSTNSGLYVERAGQYGFAKPNETQREKLASGLAALVCVSVPYVEINTVEDSGHFAISYVYSLSSKVLASKDELTRDYSEIEQEALKKASGLLPFLAWISASDHHDDTNLVCDKIGDDEYRIVAIDFEHAFGWEQGKCKVIPPASPALVNNLDSNIVRKHLEKIEELTRESITKCCVEAGFQHAQANEITETLLCRREQLRPVLANRGWLA